MWLMKLILLVTQVFTLNFGLVKAHGRMLDPPQRGSMWRFGFNVPSNYNDMSNYCGGISRQWETNGGKCGVCGDPWDQNPREHEPGGEYATGIIGKTYYQGEEINITIDITANHYGYFEFRLCKNDEFMKKVTHECFDENLLLIYNNNEEVIPANKVKLLDTNLNKYKYFVPNKIRKYVFYVSAQLPYDVTCKYCVLQWKYHAGNSFGTTKNKTIACLGCADRQEEFFNCADIRILPRNKTITLDFNDFNQTNQTVLNGSIINKMNFSWFLIFIMMILL